MVTVAAVNLDDAVVDVVFETPWGSKSVNNLKSGKSVKHPFNTRSRVIQAGKVTVVATLEVDGQARTVDLTVPYGARSCR